MNFCKLQTKKVFNIGANICLSILSLKNYKNLYNSIKICIIQQPLKLEKNEHRFLILKIFVLFDFMYRSTEIVPKHLVSEIIPFKLLELSRHRR
jgi:hypothetical protein